MHTVDLREFLFQNWYDVIRPSKPCPPHAPNYADDGWLVEVSNPVCYGTASITTEEQSCSVGNPTLPGTGTKVHSETDYAPGFSHPIPFERHYRSKHSVTAIQTANGWLHSYSARLYQPALSTSAYALRPNGEIVRFNKSATTATWQSESGDLQLAEQLNASGVLTGWRLTQRSDNTSELFDKKGQLTHVEARNGWRLTLGYNANGQPESVTNHFGRRLTLAYDSAGRLTSMTTPGGDISRYTHDTQGSLLTVTWPDGNIKRYHYEDSRFPRALTGITDESGQRIGSYTYDAQGRVSETQRASGVDRVQFSYGTDAVGLPQTQITDFSSGAPTTRTYNFIQQGRVLRPSGVSSPCPLCGSTARSTQYDATGRKTREVSHDGSVTFYAYNAAGQETERATFPASFSSATTRPALSNATSVVSTMWDGTLNLPARIAEPGRSTVYNYNAQTVTATITTATTDTTGALKFNGTATGPTSTTQYAYNANNLNTSITELTNGVQTQRWNLAYDALGDLTSITDVTAGNAVARVTQVDGNGRVMTAKTIQGDEVRVTYSLRGFVTSLSQGGQLTRYVQSPNGQTTLATMPNGKRLTYEYDSSQRLLDIKLDGVSLNGPNVLRVSLTTEPATRLSRLMELLRRGMLGSIPSAHAQIALIPGRGVPVPVPGQEYPGQPLVSAWDLMMQSEGDRPLPTATLVRRIAKAIDKLCECDPNGYSKPTLTFLSISKMIASGHVPAVLGITIPGQSTFDATVVPDQSFVDTVVIRTGTPSTTKDGNLSYYVSNVGFIVGKARGASTKGLRLIVAPSCVNKGSPYKPNEVISFYPEVEGLIK